MTHLYWLYHHYDCTGAPGRVINGDWQEEKLQTQRCKAVEQECATYLVCKVCKCVCIKTTATNCTTQERSLVKCDPCDLHLLCKGGGAQGTGSEGGGSKKRVTLLVPGCGCSLTLLATAGKRSMCSILRNTAAVQQCCQEVAKCDSLWWRSAVPTFSGSV